MDLAKRGLLIASILLAVSGCRLPLLPHRAISKTDSWAYAQRKVPSSPSTLVKPISFETPTSPSASLPGFIKAGNTSDAQDDRVQANSSLAERPAEEIIVNNGSLMEHTESMPWSFAPLTDAHADANDLSGLFDRGRSTSLIGRLWDDQENFYSPESLTLLGSGLVVGGAMANTSIDEGIQKHFQSSVRGATSDDWFESLHASKELGNGVYTLPIFATTWAAGELFPENEIIAKGGLWGERSIRGFMVGAPPLMVMQQLTGGSRPTETNESSEWHPLRDNNGISGHAFMGSLPFITAARMTDNRAYKMLFYAGSAVAPLSRVNDNAHYPSQVALGWWMAYLAASAIDASDNPSARWKFYPYTDANGSGMLAELRF